MHGFSTVLAAARRLHGRHLTPAQIAGLAWRAAAAQCAFKLPLMQLERVLISHKVAVCAFCALLQAQHTLLHLGYIAALPLTAAATATGGVPQEPADHLLRT
jgi:hypothetical protein